MRFIIRTREPRQEQQEGIIAVAQHHERTRGQQHRTTMRQQNELSTSTGHPRWKGTNLPNTQEAHRYSTNMRQSQSLQQACRNHPRSTGTQSEHAAITQNWDKRTTAVARVYNAHRKIAWTHGKHGTIAQEPKTNTRQPQEHTQACAKHPTIPVAWDKRPAYLR